MVDIGAISALAVIAKAEAALDDYTARANKTSKLIT
jgi:hypothetical protein